MDLWLKSVAPSTGLRKWFNHVPARWHGFKKRYFAELDQKPQDVATLIDAVKKGPVTLLFSAKDSRNNQAVALKEYLSACLKTRQSENNTDSSASAIRRVPCGP